MIRKYIEKVIIQSAYQNLITKIYSKQFVEVIPTSAEPIINHLGSVHGVCPQDYPIAYAHLLLSCCFELEPSTFFYIIIVKPPKDIVNSVLKN